MVTPELLPFQKLDVYVAAKELARLVHTAHIRDAELRDQATRAAKSVFLQLCEGLPHRGTPLGRRYFATANASLCETLGAMDLAAAIGAVAGDKADAAQALGVRLTNMLRALMR